jgi:hypothetical protein
MGYKSVKCLDCPTVFVPHSGNHVRCPVCAGERMSRAKNMKKSKDGRHLVPVTKARIVDYKGDVFEDETFVLDWLHDRIVNMKLLKDGIHSGLYPVGTVVEIDGARKIVTPEKHLVLICETQP